MDLENKTKRKWLWTQLLHNERCITILFNDT